MVRKTLLLRFESGGFGNPFAHIVTTYMGNAGGYKLLVKQGPGYERDKFAE